MNRRALSLSKGKWVCDSSFIDTIMNVYTVYILKNSKNHLYIGCTANLDQRLTRHNAGDGAEFTKRNKDFILVYEETFSTLLEARRREKQIKGWTREKKENLIKFGKPIIKE